MLAEGVYFYLLDFALAFLFLLAPFNKKILFGSRLQFYLFIYWLFIIASTSISVLRNFEIVGLAKSIKGILYVPLIYLGAKFYDQTKVVKSMVTIGILAGVFNLIFLVININTYGFNLWDIKTISSGFSNRCFNPLSMSIEQIEGGAHNIWGNYNVIVFILAMYGRMKGLIKGWRYYLGLLLPLMAIFSSVSRESLIVLAFVTIALFVVMVKPRKMRLVKPIFYIFALGILVLVTAIILLGDQIPLISKLMYTLDSVQSTGTESNFQIRVNTWILYLDFVFSNPMFFLTGVGYNNSYFIECLNSVNSGNLRFASGPESLAIQSLAFGGLGAVITVVLFFGRVIFKLSLSSNLEISKILLGFMFGVIIVNIFAGSSAVADLLYSHILLLVGFFIISSKSDKSISEW